MKRRRLLFINVGQFRLVVRKSVLTGLFVLSATLMVLSRSDVPASQKIRHTVTNVFMPVLQVVQYPAHWFYSGYEAVVNLFGVYRQNEELKAEREEFWRLKTKLKALENENRLLGRMLNYTPPADAMFVTAKVVAQEGDGFSHSLIVYLGKDGYIRAGSAVLGEHAVVGRVESVKGSYARIILVTDINSKIPVMTEKTRARGILSGDNTATPKLLFTSTESEFHTDDALVTSGVSGVFPSGLPVGRIGRIDKDVIEVEPENEIEKLEYVKIVDYALPSVVIGANSPEEE